MLWGLSDKTKFWGPVRRVWPDFYIHSRVFSVPLPTSGLCRIFQLCPLSTHTFNERSLRRLCVHLCENLLRSNRLSATKQYTLIARPCLFGDNRTILDLLRFHGGFGRYRTLDLPGPLGCRVGPTRRAVKEQLQFGCSSVDLKLPLKELHSMTREVRHNLPFPSVAKLK